MVLEKVIEREERETGREIHQKTHADCREEQRLLEQGNREESAVAVVSLADVEEHEQDQPEHERSNGQRRHDAVGCVGNSVQG